MLPALSAWPSSRCAAGRLDDLAALPGVRGVAPDAAAAADRRRRTSAAVPASTGLGGPAGQRGAGRGVRVAVVDTGVSDTAALDRASGRLVDAVDSADGAHRAPFADGYGHGTFMATVVAGGPRPARRQGPSASRPAPRSSSSGSPDAQGTTSLSQVLAGLDWVAAHPDEVDVANLSFAHERPGEGYGADPLDRRRRGRPGRRRAAVVAAGNARPGRGPRLRRRGR